MPKRKRTIFGSKAICLKEEGSMEELRKILREELKSILKEELQQLKQEIKQELKKEILNEPTTKEVNTTSKEVALEKFEKELTIPEEFLKALKEEIKEAVEEVEEKKKEELKAEIEKIETFLKDDIKVGLLTVNENVIKANENIATTNENVILTNKNVVAVSDLIEIADKNNQKRMSIILEKIKELKENIEQLRKEIPSATSIAHSLKGW
jgi:hypothetical protein